jgi:hypothetical protein
MGKKSDNTIWWALGLGAAGFALYQWAKSQTSLIQFGSVSVPYQAIKSGSLVLGLRLPVINASAIGARVTGFTGFILTPSGSVIGSVFMDKAASIQPNQKSELAFTAYLKLSDLAFEAGTQALGSGFPTTWPEIQKYLKGFRLKGQVRIFGFPIPIEMPLI